ncbi:error-prone DNA polymerase [Rhizorhapis sp. SPR117]|uniref:error-prone DNA polymerase n=1 Tax=Rhizorhapis sp. SPR117 TaxID=2912611 RepID=UPI001F001E83|nr:error-prone DNA polymerase [Rhizorhapis sp. SPR117]
MREEARKKTCSSDHPAYAELAAATNFSFLRGASHPADMVETAIALDLSGIGIADRNSVAGVVRAHMAWKEALEDERAPLDFRLVVGARLVFADGTPDILAYPASRHGWGRLTRLLTLGNLRAEKGDCILHLSDLLEHLDELLLIAIPPIQAGLLEQLRNAAPGRVWLGARIGRSGRDARQLVCARALAMQCEVPLIALGDALYATPDQRPLHDVLTAIGLKTTVQAAGRRLAANAERHLKPPVEMARMFAAAPEAIAQTQAFFSRIAFTLDDLKYEYPHEPVPYGWEPLDWLEHLVMEAAHKRYGPELPEKVQRLLGEEFTLIRAENYAYYFLTVHDIVRFARSRGILCQGRGSAANSIVCFLLGVTSVDPMQHDLLFSRFMSSERKEPPDIDVDFEHERREEVMQYIYKRYGRERAGIAATVIHYRPRSAVREVGKALGLSEDVTAHMASTVWGSHASKYERKRVAESGFDPDNPEIARLNHFVQQILEFPRHLSQHVGGFILTEGRLDETVPIHNGGMPDRTFIEWDKDDIDALGLMKVDVLALGMLTCIRKAFDMMRAHDLGDHSLEVDIKSDDPAVYDMLCAGDSIGVFQVESRAQMNMLPRLRPREFYDLVVQVAIVRPGPIEGDMVHPYLRRRCGDEKVDFPSPAPPHPPNELQSVLGKTYGVPIFQEQAMKLAITAAAFTSDEANGLRRAMATFRRLGTIPLYRDKMIGGMVARGYEKDFAERCFKQIEGFGSYGFPESHAQSFARLVYVSSWIKCYHPAVFTAALLNSQPMGFYAPAQLVRDAREHGVEVRSIDVNASAWDNGMERGPNDTLALRLGFRQISGFREKWGQAIDSAARAAKPFTSIEDITRRANLPQRALRLLADADAFGSLGLDRRAALWEVRRIPDTELPLFAAARARELGEEPEVALRPMSLGEHVAADYQMTRLSLKEHPMALLRRIFDKERVTPCAALRGMKGGEKVCVAGVVLMRQRPGKGNAIFITLEDEGGIANIVLWARQFEIMRREVMASRLMRVEGEVQRSREGVIHVMASRIIDRTDALGVLSEMHAPDSALAHADAFIHPVYSRQSAKTETARHPRNVRLLPRSRDFH